MTILQKKYQSRGFSVLAFPTNDFHQELSTNQEIQEFVQSHFFSQDPPTSFPIFGITSLQENAVYQALQEQLPEAHVQHNFFKFLVNRNGKAIKMFHKKQDPITLMEEIEKLLDENEEPRHKLVME